MHLPALRVSEKSWRGHDGSPSEILAALAQPPADPRQPTRKTVLEQVVEPAGKLVALPLQAQEFALDARRLVGAGATP